MIRFEVVESLKPEYNTAKEYVKYLLNSIDNNLRSYYELIAQKADPRVLIGLPFSPVHFYLAMYVVEGYYNKKNNTIYILFNPKRMHIFLRVLTHELTHTYFHYLLEENLYSENSEDGFQIEKADIELLGLVDETLAYHAPLRYGVCTGLINQMNDLVDVFCNNIFEKVDYCLNYVLAPRVLAYIVYLDTTYDTPTLADMLTKDPRNIFNLADQISDKNHKRAFLSALYSALPNYRGRIIVRFDFDPKSFSFTTSNSVLRVIRQEEIDPLIRDLIFAVGALSKLIEIKGTEYVRRKYGKIIDTLKKQEYLSSTVNLMLKDPSYFINMLNDLAPGLKKELEKIAVEEYLDTVFTGFCNS